MSAERVALAVGLLILSSPAILVFLVYRYFRRRRARRAAEASVRAATVPRRVEPPLSHLNSAPERPTAPPPPAQPNDHSEFRFAAFDIETANGRQHSICQVGIALVRRDGSMLTRSTYVDPEEAFTNTPIHGIAAGTVAGSPLWPAVLDAISPTLSALPVVQHSGFDRSAVRAACAIHGIPEPPWRWIDSVGIARRAWPQLIGNDGHGLASLKRHLSIEFVHHDAEEDARAAAMVVLRAEVETGFDFIDGPKPPRKSAPRDPVMISLPDRDALRDLIAALDASPVLDPTSAKALNDAHFREAASKMTAPGVTFGQVSNSVLSPYWSEADPQAAMRSVQNDLGEQVRIVRELLNEWLTRGEIAPPAYAWRITVILRKAKEFDLERLFLSGYCRHFGQQCTTVDAKMVERARKIGAV